MKDILKRLVAAKPRLLMPPAVALSFLISHSGKGVYASSDNLFKGAVFGRDSLEVGEDLIKIRPRLVHRILLTLASLQGESVNNKSEEEPGKIIHEYRTAVVDGRQIKDVQKHIFHELGVRWGGTDSELAYYGSVDATPLFIRLVCMYSQIHGRNMLKQIVVLRSGKTLKLEKVVENAVTWLTTRLDQSRSGLLEYKRQNPHGIENQVWKDSREFYVHTNGQFANHHGPIASIELQGLAYDALVMASELFPDRSVEWNQIANELRTKTLELLWQPGHKYFALGTDYQKNDLRIIETKTANPAALLDSSFFDYLNADEQQKYISGIVNTIMGTDFLTDAGIRSRALSNSNLIEYWDYHGSFVTWPKETYDIAKGLRRQGFPKLAKELENRVLNLVRRSRAYLEFVYVDQGGRVMAGPPTPTRHGELLIIDSTNNPERIQAWTVSAVMAIIAGRLSNRLSRPNNKLQNQWQKDLEAAILQKIPRVSKLLMPGALAARYPLYPYKVVKDKSKASTDMPAR